MTQNENCRVQFILAQLKALSSHHHVGWVDHIALPEPLETHTFVFPDHPTTIRSSICLIERSKATNKYCEGNTTLAKAAEVQLAQYELEGRDTPSVLANCSKLVCRRSEVSWTIRGQLLVVSVPNDTGDCSATGDYLAQPSADPKKAVFNSEPYEGFCKRMTFEREPDSWLIHCHATETFPSGPWMHLSGWRIFLQDSAVQTPEISMEDPAPT